MNCYETQRHYAYPAMLNAERSHYVPEGNPIRRLEVPGFTNVWVKDESSNRWSGTHKDRLAMDAVNLYRGIVLAKNASRDTSPLPQFSIISSGSAAIAIGRAFKEYGFPKLKVLVDKRIDLTIQKAIESSHCELYPTDLSERALGVQDILRRTDNENGLELTSHKDIAIDIGSYDTLGFEILNESPDYVFVPFGTGVTFKKLLYTAENILTHEGSERDQRYRGDDSKLSSCHFYGATTANPDTKADKLYAPHSPYAEIRDDQIQFYKNAGYCGERTGVYGIEERFIDEALQIAEKNCLSCEPSGISGLALLLQVRDCVPSDAKIIVVNTGKLRLQ